MKRPPYAGSIILILLILCAIPAYADHMRARIWIGPTWEPRWYDGPRYYYHYYPYVPDPPTVIIQQPDVYYYPAPQPAQPAPQQPPSYWYYCRDPKGYYPYVNACPGGWQKVTPTPPPTEPKE